MAVADRLKAVQIKANLIADERVRLMEIRVEVHGGLAILSGDVETLIQKQVAEDLAYDVDGIEEVENLIRIAPALSEDELALDDYDPHFGYGPIEHDAGAMPFALSDAYSVPGPGVPSIEQFPGELTDDDIEDQLKKKLDAQNEVDVSGIKFCSANHIVFMKGILQTAEDLNRLRDIVLSVQGVMGVSTEISTEEGDTGTPI
ncbi:MAG: BON domain-containing protein [Armatimonadota bacterium]|nr:BON domain-containing protein [bacterium]